MKKIAGRKSVDDAKIDLTPMLDVVFILLIFFVVTATFLSETAINATSSDNNENEQPTDEYDQKNILFEISISHLEHLIEFFLLIQYAEFPHL